MTPDRSRFMNWQARINPVILLEFAAITFLALLFCASFLARDDSLVLSNLDPRFRLDTIEHERLSGILVPVQVGLGLTNRSVGIGHLPTWNPYLGSGTPLINNGFSYLFNPFMSLPVLLQGAVQGTKLAIVIGLVMAGYSMWFLARAAGLGGFARVSAAALYLMGGGMIAKLAGGHFQLGLSLVWPPLIFAGLLWTLNTSDRRAPVLMAVAFALLLFSGNIYYTLHVILCCTVMTLVYLIRHTDGRWRINLAGLKRIAIGALLGLGLSMIQFLPIWTVRDYVGHQPVSFESDSGQLSEQIDLSLNLANFFVPWEAWEQMAAPPVSLFPQVHYNYIGPAIFLLLGLLVVLASRSGLQRYGRLPWIALGLALMMMIWAAGQSFIINDLYRNIPLLAQFRFVGRANAIAALWLILLAGMALDSLWRATLKWPGLPAVFARLDRGRLIRLLMLPTSLWLLFLFYSVSNNVTRLALSLNNFNLFNALNERRFTGYPQALDILFQWIALALLVDTGLLLLRRRENLASIAATRALRIGLLFVALVAILDLMRVNSPLMQYAMPEGNFGSLYAYALSAEQSTNSFPVIQEPFTPSTYDGYYSGIRSWGLNEGWQPYPVQNDLIPEDAPKVLNFPGWAIVSTEFGRGSSYELSRQFVESNRNIQRRCASKTISGSDPCDLENQAASALYELPDALPYAFVASETVLTTQADTITTETAQQADVLSQDMDTIVIRATSESPRDILVVQETHFPGWQVWIDDIPATTVTVGNQVPNGPVNGFVGVAMQTGTHEYTLRYIAPGFTVGVLTSAATLILMILYLINFRLPWRAHPEQIVSTSVREDAQEQ